jgi:hypothetical protein
MKFNEKIDAENNIVKYCLKASYNDTLTDEETLEIETLHDYIRKIKFADIDFTANVEVVNGTPAVTEDEVSDTVVKVSLGKVAAKEYVLDENLEIEFSVDASRIADAELDEVLTSKALVSQAKIAVFQSKVKAAVLAELEKARKEDNAFEKETEVIM